MSGWAGIVAVVVGGATTDVVEDVRTTEVVVEVTVDAAELVEPHAAREAVAVKKSVMRRTFRLTTR